MTEDHVVIMGRKTWDSLPTKPLPNRFNIIVSSNPYAAGEASCRSQEVVPCLYDAFSLVENHDELAKYQDEVFIMGGGTIYKEALESDLVGRMYLTMIHKRYEGDTFFPTIKWKDWNHYLLSSGETREGMKYDFWEYWKKDNA